MENSSDIGAKPLLPPAEPSQAFHPTGPLYGLAKHPVNYQDRVSRIRLLRSGGALFSAWYVGVFKFSADAGIGSPPSSI